MTFPTKSDLLQDGIVTIDRQHKKITTNSLQVAAHFNKRPSEVNRRITSLNKKGLCRIAPSSYLNQQGKEQKYYELSRDQFLLVVMGFTGDTADQFKADFITLFNQVESENIYWRQQRHLTSDSTKLCNESVQWLKTALTEVIPNSKRCTMLYNHVQCAINKAATGSAKVEDRDKLPSSQLYFIEQLERDAHAMIGRLRADDVKPEQIRDDVLAMIRIANKEAANPTDQDKENGLPINTTDNTANANSGQLSDKNKE